MHFGILKVIAMQQWLSDSSIECIKFVFGRSSARPRWGAYSAPPSDPIAGLRGPYTSKGERKGWEKNRRERRGSSERDERGRKGGRPLHNPGSASDLITWLSYSSSYSLCLSVSLSVLCMCVSILLCSICLCFLFYEPSCLK